ncbi:MAG TPA: sigma 54-interacting transcriptional regulator [Candidatus Angelobacter sp.]|nr:sigma 54-interacting transcriptional regulator [Candidatus Angelobacter sp.]
MSVDPSSLFDGHPRMRAIRTIIESIADTDTTVLIRGESGVGKDLIARAIHDTSARHTGPFIKVNCAAIPSALLESELFGHEKEAFAGAHRRKRGQFEYADKGTIYLDEVAEIPSRCRRNSSTCCKIFGSLASAAKPQPRWTRASSHRRIGTWKLPLLAASSERISITGSTWARSTCPRCGSVVKRSRVWWRGFWPNSTPSTGGRKRYRPR